MRIAFYAPLKSPTHAVPSGDRRVGQLFVAAFEKAGHAVRLASSLRTYESAGDRDRQSDLRDQGSAEARDLIAYWSGAGREERPDVWFTYHVYYKAPDWLGPAVTAALGIPYAIAEASFAPKRAVGPWSLGHSATVASLRAASLILCPIRDDLPCVETQVRAGARVLLFPPFLDPAPYRAASQDRSAHRNSLAAKLGLDPSVPWIVVSAMMRSGDKAASYYMLAELLRRLPDIPWNILVAGDGAERAGIEGAFGKAAAGRARFLGECGSETLATVYAAGDLCVWPAVNEAYGMALLEAQAAGVPVVSRAVRGVPDVVQHGITGFLAPPSDQDAFTQFTRDLLVDHEKRRRMGQAAALFAGTDRSVETAARTLDRALREIHLVPLP